MFILECYPDDQIEYFVTTINLSSLSANLYLYDALETGL